MLSPFCPHITEELFEQLKNKSFIADANWPKTTIEKKASKKNQNPIENMVQKINEVLKKITTPYKKVYIYIMPFEQKIIDSEKLKSAIKKDITIFTVNDPKKYDPKNKAKHAKPGKPTVYVE